MRTALPLCLALAACAGESAPPAYNAQARADEQAARISAVDRAAVASGFTPAQPQPMRTSSIDAPKAPAPGVILPPADRPYRYLGRWASNPEACENRAWQLQIRRLTTFRGTRCDFPDVAAAPSGYRLSGECEADDTSAEETLRLSFDETKRTMRVAGRTMGPLELIYCGD